MPGDAAIAEGDDEQRQHVLNTHHGDSVVAGTGKDEFEFEFEFIFIFQRLQIKQDLSFWFGWEDRGENDLLNKQGLI